MTNARGELAFYLLQLSEFSFDFMHPSGITHRPPDAVSQLPITGNKNRSYIHDLHSLMTSETKYDGQGRSHKTSEAYTPSIEWSDSDDTNRAYYNITVAFLEALQTAYTLDLDTLVETADLVDAQVIDVYCQ